MLLLVLVAGGGCHEGGGDETILLAGGPHPEPPNDSPTPGVTPPPATDTPGANTPTDPAEPGMTPAMPDDPGAAPMDGQDAPVGDPVAPPPDGGVGTGVEVEPCGEDPESDAGAVVPDFSSSGDGAEMSDDPAADGPFSVLRLDATVPSPDPARADLSATFYAPRTAAVVADGPLPLVLVLHGFATNHVLYEHFSNHLASHGLLVLGLTLPSSLIAEHDRNALEAIAAIDFALGDDAPEAVRGRADARRIAVAGHSFGGKIGFYAASMDPRIDIVIGWDPSNAGGPPCFVDPDSCNDYPVAPNCMAMDSGLLSTMSAETFVFRAAPDGANPEPAHNAIHFFRGAPAPATMVDYDTAAAHGDWANVASIPIEHTKRLQLSLLLDRFTGAPGVGEWSPGGAQIDQGPGVRRVLYK